MFAAQQQHTMVTSLLDQTSDSKLQPRIVELTHVHSKNCDYREFLHITTKSVINPMETRHIALKFIS